MTDTASFDLLRKRLSAASGTVRAKADALNKKRLDAFGRIEPKLLARLSARTEHNCVARDVVRVHKQLLFGYQVFIGLKRETQISDVFCLYQLSNESETAELEPIGLADSFLADSRFVADFKELMTYYKLRVVQDKLLLLFRTGSQLGDRRVFRFSIEANGSVNYIDSRGERDHVLPQPFDFEWITVTREQHVLGRHPHINLADTVFVETIGGDLTVKIENNTESGLGIFSEPVEDKTQSLADAEVTYADLRNQLLIRVKPYRENTARFLIFNKRMKTVMRCDEIGVSCVQLPEDHGIVFPGGYALESGETKRFADIGLNFDGFKLKRTIKAPNGEDVLYVFYEELSGRYGLLPYNLIDRAIGQPLMAHGYARYANGTILLFVPETGEASRLHAMQLWRTPFADLDFVAQQKSTPGLLGRLGNASLVRALADLRQLTQLAEDARVIGQFESLYKLSSKCAEGYLWLSEPDAESLLPDVQMLAKTSQSALEAFEQLEKAKSKAASDVAQMGKSVRELLGIVASKLWQKPDDFTSAIVQIKRKRGELTGLSEQAHVQASAIAPLDQSLHEELMRVGERALKFFADPSAFNQLKDGLRQAASELEKATNTSQIKPIAQHLDQLAESLDGLTELISSFEGTDPQQRADLLASTSQLFGDVNRLRAQLKQKRDALLEREQGAEFSAQLKVLEQSFSSTLARAESPEVLDEALAKVMSQLEQLETRFADQPQFALELVSRRESTLEAFTAKREQLAQIRDRRVQALKEAINRVLEGVPRRVSKLSSNADVHAFFASDSLVERARAQIAELRNFARSVDADELTGKLRSLRESGLRDVRDRIELGQDGDTLKLGKHRFSVANRQIELSLVRDREQFHLSLTGTDYRQPIAADRLLDYQSVWDQLLPSENTHVYRGEFLAHRILSALDAKQAAHSIDSLRLNDAERLSLEQALSLADPHKALIAAIAPICERLPMEAYQRGVHDADVAAIVLCIRALDRNAGALRTSSHARVLAQAWYASLRMEAAVEVKSTAVALHWLQNHSAGTGIVLPESWLVPLRSLAQSIKFDTELVEPAAWHLIGTLGHSEHFPCTAAAADLAASLEAQLPKPMLAGLKESRAALLERLNLWQDLLRSQAVNTDPETLLEAACIGALNLPRERINIELAQTIGGLLGEHPRIQSGSLVLQLPEFLERLARFERQNLPEFKAFASFKHEILSSERERLKLADLSPKPLAGFVRNRLIDEVYLPLIGNNLAKQIGTLDDKRADRSGMLLLISPPGYGKTTLMEYLADRLGLIFVRINGPTLGHEVTSLDPAATSHRGAAEELIKLNLGLAMGNNVMLYLDDIQHLNPEFLQKFISLSDATRRVDAIVDGQAQTLDLRGKRFAIVMAGNPYTESGEAFRIPDMLANRADVYNLGDVLSGREALFADSYLENCLSANPQTAAIGQLGRDGVLACIRLASGMDAELPPDVSLESIEVIKRMVATRNILSKVNSAYVASAAQDDVFRTEPPFKLQGSYRNMVKLTAQLSALMTDSELDSLIRDHYRGEAQTLGARAEENLLRLASLIGQPTASEQQRWQSLVENYRALQKQGGKHSDGSTKIANLLADIALQIEQQSRQVDSTSQAALSSSNAQAQMITQALNAIQKANTASKLPSQLIAPPELAAAFQALVKSYEDTLVPLVSAMHHKMTLDHSIWEHVRQVRTDLDDIVKRDRSKKPGF
jgi:ATPase involved in DNA repair/ATPase family associated with various cellular activities (AAA)